MIVVIGIVYWEQGVSVGGWWGHRVRFLGEIGLRYLFGGWWFGVDDCGGEGSLTEAGWCILAAWGWHCSCPFIWCCLGGDQYMSPHFACGEVWQQVFRVFGIEFHASVIKFWAVSTPTGMVVVTTADTSYSLVGIAFGCSVFVCTGPTYISAYIAIACYMAIVLAFGASDELLLVLFDVDQMMVNIETFLDQFVGRFCIVYL